ncbi:uncharacterized protein EI97DRAFT_137499 [Westerdykella ornata]|uniref:Uncharacterized protein n=1 Tax=Westerdykella ornata TaxID=318751 RepID=A0A6A6JDB7_WESOR|nr:uncharacterized protein EI97DRAFT_137499 [Westerdykella ornata]KAF2274163.1 hypothetical protein EI97DRAFT_137499 [Westerdykella ornata]
MHLPILRSTCTSIARQSKIFGCRIFHRARLLPLERKHSSQLQLRRSTMWHPSASYVATWCTPAARLAITKPTGPKVPVALAEEEEEEEEEEVVVGVVVVTATTAARLAIAEPTALSQRIRASTLDVYPLELTFSKNSINTLLGWLKGFYMNKIIDCNSCKADWSLEVKSAVS